MRKKKKYLPFLIIAACILLLLFHPLLQSLRSICLMPMYSKVQSKNNLLKKENIHLKIPGGLSTPEPDWYPFVLSFCPGEDFKSYSGLDAELTIFYNFPAFDPETGISRLYNEHSPYYNSFYGAYFVQMEDRAFGFKPNGAALVEEAVLVPKYDFIKLVLGNFGLNEKDCVFEWNLTSQEDKVSYLGYDNWTAVRADLFITGMAHKSTEFCPSYLQYGRPRNDPQESFSPTAMQGLIYMRYFPEWNTSVFFYVIAADEGILRDCNQKILSKSVLF